MPNHSLLLAAPRRRPIISEQAGWAIAIAFITAIAMVAFFIWLERWLRKRKRRVLRQKRRGSGGSGGESHHSIPHPPVAHGLKRCPVCDADLTPYTEAKSQVVATPEKEEGPTP